MKMAEHRWVYQWHTNCDLCDITIAQDVRTDFKKYLERNTLDLRPPLHEWDRQMDRLGRLMISYYK